MNKQLFSQLFTIGLMVIFTITSYALPNRTEVFAVGSSVTGTNIHEPSIQVLSRTDNHLSIELQLNGFTVEHYDDGIALRLNSRYESLPPTGSDDLASLTCFIPFHYPIQAQVQNVQVQYTQYSETDLGGRIRKISDNNVASNSVFNFVPQEFQSDWIELGEPGVFRDFGVLPVIIHPIRKISFDQIQVAQILSFEIDAQPTGPAITSPILASWEGLYRTMFLGYDDFVVGRSKLWRPGSFLVLYADPVLSNLLNTFANSKRLEGYHVILQQIASNSTPTSIRNLILNQYNTLSIPLEYVLLVGDADRGAYSIATNSFTSLPPFTETVSSDHPYTMLSGNDFWPEIIIGRVTGGNATQMAVVINKNLRYQNFPGRNMINQQMTRALCFAGNYSDSGTPPVTPTLNSRWAADMLRTKGYSVSEIYYPPTFPGTSEILAQINQGLSLITYRGWGDSQGPLYPRLRVDDLNSVTSNSLSPFVSIVCQTGAFGPGSSPVPNQRCFGEVWVELGSVNDMKGGPVFFGASHLHTNTRYNNPMLAGFMEGWLTEGLEKFGMIALRSKLEVYRGFPLEPTSSEAYFHYYNILGDPSITLWQLLPDSLNVIFPTTILANAGQVTVRAIDGLTGIPQSNLVAALIAPNNVHSVAVTDNQGYATLTFRANVGDSIRIAVRGRNYRPQFFNTTASGNDNVPFRVDSVRIVDGGNGLLEFGETATLQVFIKNVSTSSANASAVLSTLMPNRISIQQNSSNAGTIGANGTGTLSYTVTAIPSTHTFNDIRMSLAFPSGNREFCLPIGWIFPIVTGYSVMNGSLTPGNTATIEVYVKNEGVGRIPQGTAQLNTFSNGAVIINGNANFNQVEQHQITNLTFTVTIPSNQIVGHVIPMRIILSHSLAPNYALINFNLTAGSRPTHQPTGPDRYGYYAYENLDIQYAAAPTYNWIELDPDSGGLGTHIRLNDDQTINLPLPFTFRYYGTNYQSDGISICSNGWVSFQNTWQTDFYNWPMPNAQGPNAMIAVMWDDLKGLAADTGRVSIWYYYNPATQDFIIQWGRMYSRYGIETTPIPQRFQLILHGNRFGPTGDNEFTMQYQIASDVDVNNNFTTVGIMDWSHLDGLEITYARTPTPGSDTLRSNRAIRFTTVPPDNFLEIGNERNENLNLQPNQFVLKGPYPNPFNNTANIRLNLLQDENIKIQVFDTQGRMVTTLLDGFYSQGNYVLEWNPIQHTSGIYYLVVSTKNQMKHYKMVYLK
ncbi:MAG: C25 family cysteine peptidase [bacterium]|nr:C25 family cysteine peptidase [bacterium]